MKLYNTQTRAKEPLEPLKAGEVKIYTCGPTVYHFVHIGNWRTFIFEDLLRRSLGYLGYKVTQVMNLTDVDDKTIRGAIQNKVSLEAFTKPYKEAFFEDLKTLNIEPAENYPQATDYIGEMIDLIDTLLKKGLAYKASDGSIYYAIRRFPRYGCLSHLHLDELQAGASERCNSDEYEKESVSDFVLWKGYDPERDGEIYWDSPYGKGRPGWHLECSAMAMRLLGDTLDIHVGGIDNMFPHHENEIAQSEGATGKPFAKLWMHAEHLIVDGKKMSKSLNNFFTLRDLLNKGYSGREVRYMLLHTHYKTQLNFTFAGLDSVRTSLARLHDFILRLKEVEADGDIGDLLQRHEEAFKAALSDDLNISQALAVLFDLIREGNALIDQKKMGREGALATLALLKRFDQVLAVLPLEQDEEAPAELQRLLTSRLEARKAKNWPLADQIRDQIHAHGWVIEDTPTGARLKKG